MRATLERLRRMLANWNISDDTEYVGGKKAARFERSSSFKKRSVRRSTRHAVRKRAVVTNRGIYYVDVSEEETNVPPQTADSTAATVNSRCSTASYTDWIQVTDDEHTLEKLPADGKKKKKKSACRNFSLEGKSVPFDSPLPSLKGEPVSSALTCGVHRPVDVVVVEAAPLTHTTVENSTFGSSCTSGIHSMEKSKGDSDFEDGESVRGVARGARRKGPAVLATKENLRRSVRRVTGKRGKKTARRDPTPGVSKVEDDFYRMFSRLPLLFAERPLCDSVGHPSSPGAGGSGYKSSAVRTPLTFNRQNPITRWLEESEKISRRTPCEGDRPLWSELVSYKPSPGARRAVEKVEDRSPPAASSTPSDRAPARCTSSSAPSAPPRCTSSSFHGRTSSSADEAPRPVLSRPTSVPNSAEVTKSSNRRSVRQKLSGLRVLGSSRSSSSVLPSTDVTV